MTTTKDSKDLCNDSLRINYPRVSEILSHYDAWSLSHVPSDVLEKACARGTEVHSHCTAIVRNLFNLECSEIAQGYVESFKKWWGRTEEGNLVNQGKLILSEDRLYDDKLKFSGQPDLVYEKDDEIILVDWKTSANFSKKYPIQISAYSFLVENSLKIKISEAQIICLSKVGRGPKIHSYFEKDLKKYYKYFSFLLELYKYNYEKGEKK